MQIPIDIILIQSLLHVQYLSVRQVVDALMLVLVLACVIAQVMIVKDFIDLAKSSYIPIRLVSFVSFILELNKGLSHELMLIHLVQLGIVECFCLLRPIIILDNPCLLLVYHVREVGEQTSIGQPELLFVATLQINIFNDAFREGFEIIPDQLGFDVFVFLVYKLDPIEVVSVLCIEVRVDVVYVWKVLIVQNFNIF